MCAWKTGRMPWVEPGLESGQLSVFIRKLAAEPRDQPPVQVCNLLGTQRGHPFLFNVFVDPLKRPTDPDLTQPSTLQGVVRACVRARARVCVWGGQKRNQRLERGTPRGDGCDRTFSCCLASKALY